PTQVSMGCICQYTLMPFLAYLISRLLKLPADIAAGLILLGSCPGRTSSSPQPLTPNPQSHHILKHTGDVLMTTGSTLLAPLATPTLVSMLAGNLVRIDGVGLVVSTFQVVLGPVAMGLLIHHLIPGLAEKAKTFTPLISVLIVSLICGSIVGQTASTALIAGPVVLLAVFLLHSLGFVLGFMVPKLFGYPCRVSRTTSIEVGIQSSALAVVLATRHFPNPVLSALPCAISATVQSMLGSAVAIYWNRMPLTGAP
ncbi:bile acid:Na+ symporter family protein, partial [Baffinella frigidus]